MPNTPNQYKHVAAWGDFLRSFPYYVKAQQERAALDGAPLDAISLDAEGGRWQTIRDVCPETLAAMRTTLERHGLPTKAEAR